LTNRKTKQEDAFIKGGAAFWGKTSEAFCMKVSKGSAKKVPGKSREEEGPLTFKGREVVEG